MNLTKAQLIAIIGAHSVSGTPIPIDFERWRRDLAEEIMDTDAALERKP